MAACNIGQVQYMYLSREVIQRFVAVSCLRNQLRLPSQDTLVRALLLSIGGPLPNNLSPQQATVVRGILPDYGQSLSIGLLIFRMLPDVGRYAEHYRYIILLIHPIQFHLKRFPSIFPPIDLDLQRNKIENIKKTMVTNIQSQYQLPRDFEGFGAASHDCKWPNGARIAVSFVLNYEEGGERSILEGDAHSEPYLWEKGSSGGHREGARYLNAEQDFEYGSRVGVWRLMRLFAEFDWKITVYAVARAMQLNPEFGKYCVQTGHEIANHGMRWLDFHELDPEQDKQYVKDSQRLLYEVTGEFPVGVYFGRSTANTPGRLAEDFKEMHKELGTPKLLYSSECYNDDVPYWVDLPYEEDLPDEEKEGMLLVVSVDYSRMSNPPKIP